jgi:hypothetical protein
MKKLGKLKLNSEKMLSHDELVSFKGGSDFTRGDCPNVAIIEHCFWDECGGTSSGNCYECCVAVACGAYCA